MNFITIFIQRPIGTILLALGLGVAGAIAYFLLPIASLPQIDSPSILVEARLPGASPEKMASSVAMPLEKHLSQISGITQMTGMNALGVTRITIVFDLTRHINGAAREVAAAINASYSELPPNLPTPPVYYKLNPSDAPIMVLSVTSDQLPIAELLSISSSILLQKISKIDGVGMAYITGNNLPAVRIELNPTALSSYNIGLPQVAEAIAAANVNQAKGQITIEKNNTAHIVTNDVLLTPSQYASTIITYRNNSPVRIANVGYVTQSVQNVQVAGLFNKKDAVLIYVYKQPGANIVQTIGKIKASFPFLKATISPAINLDVAIDRSVTIRAEFHDIKITLLLAIILVVFVTYLFLGHVKDMIIPGIAVPLSVLGTFTIMHLLGYSLNTFSLMALTIATGFIVDDVVVVIENIARHLEMGKALKVATLEGFREVAFTVISMSISLIIVFTPMLLMGGMVGRLLHEFAITLSIAIFISMIISLTVTPVLSSLLLSRTKAQNSSYSVRLEMRMLEYYKNSLIWSLQHNKFMLLIFLVCGFLSILLFLNAPKSFFPLQDTGIIEGFLQTDQKLSFQASKKIMKKYMDVILKDPAVQNVAASMGPSISSPPGFVEIALKPLKIRKIYANEVIDRLKKELEKIHGAQLLLIVPQDIKVGARLSSAQYQYTLLGDDIHQLDKWGRRITRELSKLPGISDVNSDQRDQGLEMFVEVDRDKASRLGIDTKQIDDTLYTAFGQGEVSTMYLPMTQNFVVLEVAPHYWQRPKSLDEIYVLSSKGKAVPLSAFAHFIPKSTMVIVNQQNLSTAVTISFNLVPGTSLKQAMAAISKTISQMDIPSTIQGSFQGTAEAFQSQLAMEPYLILGAFFAIYIILGMLYESLLHPITVLSALPSAGVGALLALKLTHLNLTIIALIGIILLIGIVKKNAIMMIDFAIENQKKRQSPHDAILNAAVTRFRPIIMTTCAALLGAIPLVTSRALGVSFRQPLGIAIIGGLLLSQLITLYTVPSIYLILENLKAKFYGAESKDSERESLYEL